MPVPSSIADLSQTPASNFPIGSEYLTTADDYFRAHAGFIAELRDKSVVSVTDAAYGATGDGTTDDTAAIQACIDANPGKVIYFPAGAYKVTDTIDVTATRTSIVGDGPATRIIQYTADIDTFWIRPTTAGSTSAFLSLVSISDLFISHAQVAASHTAGAALRVTQCEAYKVHNIYYADAFAGIVIEGGQAGDIDNLWGYSVTGSYAGADTALLHFTQATYAGPTYQAMFTTEVRGLNLSGGGKRDTVIRVTNCDGLHFSDGYINNGGGNSLVKLKAERDNSYMAALGFSNFYLDGLNTCDNGFDIPADGFSNSFIYHLNLDRNVFIGNFLERGILARKPEFHNFVCDAQIINCTLWGIDAEGGASGSVFRLSPTTSDNGDGSTGDIRIAGSGRSLTVNGFTSKGAETVAIKIEAGTWGRGSIIGCTNDSNVADIVNAGTFTNGLQLIGNVSAWTGAAANSWSATVGNGQVKFPSTQNASTDANTLDDYEEGTFTPTITFGGAAVGVTYATQEGNYTKVGNRVFFDGILTLAAKGSSTGVAVLVGLPFTVGATVACSIHMTSVTSGVGDTFLSGRPSATSTGIRIDKIAAGVGTQLTEADFTDNTLITFSGHYKV
jgi:hypothetical protein